MEELKEGLIINNRYRLEEYKGSGSFGEVWRATDLNTGVEIAIKIYISLDKRGCDEFLEEYRIASGLVHRNLLVTEQYDVWESRPYLTMKYCSKGSASSLVGRLTPSPDNERLMWNFIHDVAAGLAYLHSIEPDPIVHQDIKPDNVLMDADGVFMITDFGISKKVRNTMRQQSSRAQTAGATAYMAPERFSSHPTPILASDVWSLGVSIYEMAEGELPFAGMGGVMLKNGAEMVSLSDGWSKGLTDIMQFCLEKEPWNRAKAHEVEKVAENVLKSNLTADVCALIQQTREDREKSDTANPKIDPRATQCRTRESSNEAERDPQSTVRMTTGIKSPEAESAKNPVPDKDFSFKYAYIGMLIVLIGVVLFRFGGCSQRSYVPDGYDDIDSVEVNTVALYDDIEDDSIADVESDYSSTTQVYPDTYIKADGKTALLLTSDADAGYYDISVTTDAKSWSTWGVPSWCTISNKKKGSFRLSLKANSSTAPRNDYMELRTPKGHSVQINIKQDGKTANTAQTSSSGPTAKIEKTWVILNQSNASVDIHVKFTIQNMKGKQGRVAAYFYDNNGNALRDTNKLYYTSDGCVAVHDDITPGYDDTVYNDLTLSIPYSELHQTGSGSRTLKYSISIWDKSVTPVKEIVQSNYTKFIYTPGGSSSTNSSASRSTNTSDSEAFLVVNGITTSTSKYFTSSGGSATFYVESSTGTYDLWGVPSWCKVTNRTPSSFTLVCNSNPSSNARNDYMKVKGAGMEIRIDIQQQGN